MYLYGFNKYAGVDKIWKSDGDFIQDFKIKAGDLLQIGEDFYLSLGDEISFSEQYVYGLKAEVSKIEILHKKLLNKQTLQLFHRMVYQRYSTYKNVSKLFLPQEIDKLLDRKLSKKLNTSKNRKSPIFFKEGSGVISILNQKINLSQSGQTLIIFPDLRTLINLTNPDFREDALVDTLLSTNTQNQKDKSRRNITNGNTQIILATHSEIFQNYKKLSNIIMIQPHKRYYANQQDPRYKTLDVVNKLAKIWDCHLEVID